jgi:hypothetical protein
MGDVDDEDVIGPNDLTIRTPEGTVAEPERWLPLVHRTLREPDGFLIVDSGPPDTYVQAINHEGSLLLEYRDGSPERHFQVRDVGLDDVAEALAQWTRRERGFIEKHEWQQLWL